MIKEPLLQIPANSQIFVLTGAGIGKESGIQTFRDNDGLWNDHRIEDVASPEGFYRNPTLVYDFYNNRRKELNSGTEANKGHFDLYELEKSFKINIITQNIDNLHEKAGSSSIIHMHGELNKARCLYWEIMNEPEFKMFFKGKEDEFVEIFNFSSKIIKEKQKDSIIVMAGAAGMFPENKKFWKSALPKIKDNFVIANIHHISGQDGKCDKEFWVDEFASLLKNLNINKPIWVTEAMTGKCKPVSSYIYAFVNGAELIIDVGMNAPGMKMSKKNREKLKNFIKQVDRFKSVELISKKKAEFTMSDGSKKTIEF
jgi:hypothetical protein